jgi:hypothetical protein
MQSALPTRQSTLVTPSMNPETASPERKTLYDRWADEKTYSTGWDLRAKAAAGLLRQERWICDLGCGMQSLRSLIPESAIYLPADLNQWTPDTLVCELNQGMYPVRYLRMCDVCFVLGVIEYLWRPDLLFAILGEQVEVAIFSYNVTDLFPANRSELWVNAFSEAELCSIAGAAGFDITDKVGPQDKTQMIFRAQNGRYGYRPRFLRALSRMNYRLA